MAKLEMTNGRYAMDADGKPYGHISGDHGVYTDSTLVQDFREAQRNDLRAIADRADAVTDEYRERGEGSQVKDLSTTSAQSITNPGVIVTFGKPSFPHRIIRSTRYWQSFVKELARRRKIMRTCNICGYYGAFGVFGLPPRFDSQCVQCESLERHRFVARWLRQAPEVVADRDVLHFAPEAGIGRVIRSLARRYITADCMPGRADMTLNMESIDLPDQSFGSIVCSHVLEHVKEDASALLEMYRVLEPGGIAIILVPMIGEWSRTHEDSAIVEPRDRKLHFGQIDHVRLYGKDLRERIRNAGFVLEEITAEEPEVTTYSLIPGDKIFVARKPLV